MMSVKKHKAVQGYSTSTFLVESLQKYTLRKEPKEGTDSQNTFGIKLFIYSCDFCVNLSY